MLKDYDGSLGYRFMIGVAPVAQFYIDRYDEDDEGDTLRGGAPALAFMPYVAMRLSPYNDDITRLYCATKMVEGHERAQKVADDYARKQARYRSDKADVSDKEVKDHTDWSIGQSGRCVWRGFSAYLGGIAPHTANLTDTSPSGEMVAYDRSVQGGFSAGLAVNVYAGFTLVAGWSVLFASFGRPDASSTTKRTRIVTGPTLGIGYSLEVGKLLAGKF